MKRVKHLKTHYSTTSALVEKQRKDWAFHSDARFLLKLKYIALDAIRPNRGDFIAEHVEDIKEAMLDGITFPPVVLRKYPHERKYSIRDGTHRDLASRALGFTHIPAIVQETVRIGVMQRLADIKKRTVKGRTGLT